MSIKLVFFDMEGVILENNTYDGIKLKSFWARLAKELGEDAWAGYLKTFQKWEKREYKNYFEWVDEILKIYIKEGLNKKIYDKILKEQKFTKGAIKVFRELKKKNIKTAIVSGGFKDQVENVAKKLRVDHSTSACELFWEKGRLKYWNVLPFDEEGKKVITELIRKSYGFKKEECLFIGNDSNDVQAAKYSNSVSFNGNKKLDKVCNKKIKDKNLLEIKKYL